MNRVEMLKEMGITPVWVPRHAPAPASAAARKPLVEAVPVSQAAETRIQSASSASTPLKMALDPERASLIAQMDWPQLKQSVAGCQACTLCQSRTNTVFGTGDEQADWLIVGEAPGQEEDRQGEPFVGPAGQLLDSMLAAIDLNRSTRVYIANTLKCCPPGNRNPEPHELAQCAPHLARQVELIAPKVILLMGRFAVQALLHTDASIASLRGRVHTYQGIPAVVTYHPAYLLRTLTDKAKAWEDLLFARSLLTGTGTAPAPTSSAP